MVGQIGRTSVLNPWLLLGIALMMASSASRADGTHVPGSAVEEGPAALDVAASSSVSTRGDCDRPQWVDASDERLIGYTELRTNLPGGRAANVMTSRAMVVRADGTGRRELAPELIANANTWTQFAGWSPDGRCAIVNSGWESSDNAAWEEEHRTFRMVPGAWLLDCYLIDLATGKATNLTSVERVSHYNSGLFFWPRDPERLGFTPLIDGQSRPFAMQRDGTGKTDLSQQAGFTYGFNASPDGSRIAYHQDYKVYLADADGTNKTEVQTGLPFNFAPQWSPDGSWVAFVAGVRENCHPYVVRRDGTGLRKLADRGGYQGWMQFLDVPDYHDGSSDVPTWSADGRYLYYTAQVGDAVELMRTSLDGRAEQLSRSAASVLHYHPSASPDRRSVLFGATRDGVRQLYVAQVDGSDSRPITALRPGYAAMHGHWRPEPRNVADDP
jgi:Tol biopolymer transport system component